MAAVNCSEIRRPKLLLNAFCCSAVIFAGLYFHRADYFEDFRNAAGQRETIDRALSLIPEDASVASSTFFLANLSKRSELYELERTAQSAEYYVLDLRFETEAYSVWDYFTEDYETVFYESNIVGVFRRKE